MRGAAKEPKRDGIELGGIREKGRRARRKKRK